jgi:hypothetical protein
VVGESVRVNFTVTSPGGTPAGPVTVTASTGEMCMASAADGFCSITFNSPNPPAGRTLRARYDQTANFNESTSAPVSITVARSGTTTVIGTITPGGSSGQGQTITVPVTVAPSGNGAGTPTGAVNITVDGGSEACTINLTAAQNGMGSCQLIGGLAAGGQRTIRAAYVGDTNFAGSVGTRLHTGTVSISGFVRRNNDPSLSTPLAGVTVSLTGPGGPSQFTTGADGRFEFPGLAAAGSYTVTPTLSGFTFGPISRTYNSLQANITNADFMAFGDGRQERNLTVRDTFVVSPNDAEVPVILNSLGNERQVNFSLTFDTAILSNPSAACGPDAVGCTIVQTNAAGAVGIAVTLAALPAAGLRDIVHVTFDTLAGANANTPVLFGDDPRPRLTTEGSGDPLATGYTGGFVVFAQQGFEGDLAPRSTGDGVYRANDVEVSRLLVAGGPFNATTNEFERADVAPYETKGDGQLRANDFQLTKNYVAAIVQQQPAGGPDVPIAAAAPLAEKDPAGRSMRIVASTVEAGKATVTVEMDSLGDETVALFTLNYDPSILGSPRVALAKDSAAEGVTLTANTDKGAEGSVTVLLDSPTPFIAGYSKRLVTITFEVARGTRASETSITFNDSGSLSDPEARSLDAVYTDGVIRIKTASIRGGLLLFNQNLFRLVARIGG